MRANNERELQRGVHLVLTGRELQGNRSTPVHWERFGANGWQTSVHDPRHDHTTHPRPPVVVVGCRPLLAAAAVFVVSFFPHARGGCNHEFRRCCCLHLSCCMCPLRAVVLVKTAPQWGHDALDAWPDFSRWWRRRLLDVENCRPLHPWSQHRGLGRLWTTRTCPPSGDEVTVPGGLDVLPRRAPPVMLVGIWYIRLLSCPTGRGEPRLYFYLVSHCGLVSILSCRRTHL